MARKVMLPRPKDPEHDWPQTGRFFPLNYDAVHHNLGPDEELGTEGIPSPWAQMLLPIWRLQNQAIPSGQEAVDQLRLILLLQFLGRLDGHLVRLTPSDQEFGRLARVMRLLGRDTDTLVMWRARSLPGIEDGRVIAGSHPDCGFFLGANVDTVHLRKALLASYGPGSERKFLDNAGEVSDPSFAATLAEYVAVIASTAGDGKWGIAFRRWETELRALGGRAVPTARTGLALPRTTVEFRQWVDVAPWDCPQCVRTGQSWMNVQGPPQQLSKATSTVLCPEHRVAIRRNSGTGDPVGHDDFGAYPSGGILYVWTDEGAWPVPRTRPSEILPGADGFGIVKHYFNRQTVEVHGQLVALDQMKLATVAWMARRDGQDPLPVDVPIRGGYASLLRKCSRDDVGRKWQIRFWGRPDIIEVGMPQPSARAPWKTSAIIVWPPRRLSGWTTDYVAASAPQPPEKLSFRIVSKRTDGRFEVSPARRLLGLYRTRGASVAYIEVGEGIDGEFQPLGLIRARGESEEALVSEKAPTTHAGTAEVVLDFGTSNSAVLWRLPGEEKCSFIRSGIPGTDLASSACQLTFSEEWFQNLLRAVAVLLPWYPEDGEPRPFAPSLLAEPSDGTPGGERCIPPRKLGLLTLLGDRPRVVGNLKWGDDWNVPSVRGRVASYLELLLLPVLWDLKTNGVTNYSLKATYPLAFDDHKLSAYREIITNVAGDLALLTGINSSTLAFHSESTAGGALLERGNMTHEISLDLGGGTLDIAVLVGEAGQALTTDPPGAVLAADSLPYGGRDLLRAVITAYGRFLPQVLRQPGLPLLETDRQGLNDQVVNFCLEHFETTIHRGGPAELIQLLQHAPEGVDGPEFLLCQTDLRLRWEALLAGLQLYVRSMLHGAIAGLAGKKDITVSFNLLGQGWELLRLFDANVSPQELLAPRLKRIAAAVVQEESGETGQVIVQAIPRVRNLKTAIVEGADRLPAGTGSQPASAFLSRALAANTKNTFVGMSLYSGDKEVAKPTMKISQLTWNLRPDKPGDIGYRRVINRLWAEVPESEQPSIAAALPLRDMVKQHLLQSSQYRRVYQVQDVEAHVILRGQTTFNKAWPSGGGGVPTTSLLGEFLVSVWKDIWSKTALR